MNVERKKATNTCSVFGCGSRMGPSFKLPNPMKGQDRFRAWVRALNNPCYKNLSDEQIFRRGFVCVEHFLEEDFLPRGNEIKLRLRPTSVPTVKLSQVQAEEQTHQHEPQVSPVPGQQEISMDVMESTSPTLLKNTITFETPPPEFPYIEEMIRRSPRKRVTPLKEFLKLQKAGPRTYAASCSVSAVTSSPSQVATLPKVKTEEPVAKRSLISQSDGSFTSSINKEEPEPEEGFECLPSPSRTESPEVVEVPPLSCFHCKVVFDEETDYVVSCSGPCGQKWHVGCSGLQESDIQSIENDNFGWFCNNCKLSKSSVCQLLTSLQNAVIKQNGIISRQGDYMKNLELEIVLLKKEITAVKKELKFMKKSNFDR